jgi:choline dehydrogenase-like flavoprotein
VGREWLDQIALSTHMTSWVVQMRAFAEGTIRERPWGTDIRFDLTKDDMTNLKKGIALGAEMLFAAGAREVIPFVHGLPRSITTGDEVEKLRSGPDDPRAYTLAMSHMFGTARMSVREGHGVVGPDFKVHGTDNLFVADSSVFPTNTGVNPQHTIMAVAMHAATKIAAD